MLSGIGIIGWQNVEAIVLSALVARQPLMLVGSHGSNKTDGARLLSYATLGRTARFQAYDTRLIHQDDLLGFANPASLREGVVTYAHTDISIWGAKSVLLDEFNRTNPFVASKTMEIVRTKKVQGRSLDLELVFASANPPGGIYDTVFLDPAVASRFCIIRVPDQLSSTELDDVLALPDDWTDSLDEEKLAEFRMVIDQARAVVFEAVSHKKVRDVVRSVILSLRTELTPAVYVSPRQGRMMVQALVACEALNTVRPSLGFTEKDKVGLLLSLIPEVSGMCRTTREVSSLKPLISRTLSGFRLNDPLTTTRSLLDLLGQRIADMPVWAASVKKRVQTSTDAEEVHAFLLKLRLASDLDSDTFSSLCRAGIERYLTLESRDNSELVRISWDRTELISYIRDLLTPASL